MYLDITKSGKYRRVLLRDSYRENGKVKHHTIANLSKCTAEEIEAIRLALKHKKHLEQLAGTGDQNIRQGYSVGAVLVLYAVAERLRIIDALGTSRQGKLALWQVLARVISQGSRLSATRLASTHAACDALDMPGFNEDSLYENLKWLSTNQTEIEDCLMRSSCRVAPPALYLYDVTSSYLEGEHNFYGAFGYNRDGKKGKRQIVIGLLCDQDGAPLSIEVFHGNTGDVETFSSQIRKVKHRFGAREVVLVGDRGMIKSEQVKDILGNGFHYITAITKPQIEKLLKEGTFDMSLFDSPLAEVTVPGEGVRYILRRNPLRADEVAAGRQRKMNAVGKLADAQSKYLAEHPKAHGDVAERKVTAYIEKLKMSELLTVRKDGRTLLVETDADAVREAAKLDGCYVIKTDVPPEAATREIVHDRYKDLAKVEWAFRTSKTGELEVRPIYVRTKDSTRGHVFVVMLSYLIVRELAKCWNRLEITVEEGIRELDTLCTYLVETDGKVLCQKIPEPRDSTKRLIEAVGVTIPEVIVARGIRVATRKKLVDSRKRT